MTKRREGGIEESVFLWSWRERDGDSVEARTGGRKGAIREVVASVGSAGILSLICLRLEPLRGDENG